jgi:UDP-N-acetylmuramate: L-alanyl-gamma-D-glutamyl-meso-diaminopimelate ligase
MHEKRLRVHFLGIGGTGMATAAALAAEAGFSVSGSDAGVFPPMSDFLRERGLEVREGYRPENLAPAPTSLSLATPSRAATPRSKRCSTGGSPTVRSRIFCASASFPGGA